MKKLLLLFCLLPAVTFAQKITINGKEGNRPLVWKDFDGKVNKEAPYWAATYASIGCDLINSDGVKNGETPKFQVTVGFGKESWANRKKELSDDLLKHEQGHFDIALICGAELQKRLDDTTFTLKTCRAVSSRMYQEAYAKLRKMQFDYDRETNHSKNSEEQAKWNAALAAGLARYAQLSLTNAQ